MGGSFFVILAAGPFQEDAGAVDSCGGALGDAFPIWNTRRILVRQARRRNLWVRSFRWERWWVRLCRQRCPSTAPSGLAEDSASA